MVIYLNDWSLSTASYKQEMGSATPMAAGKLRASRICVWAEQSQSQPPVQERSQQSLRVLLSLK